MTTQGEQSSKRITSGHLETAAIYREGEFQSQTLFNVPANNVQVFVRSHCASVVHNCHSNGVCIIRVPQVVRQHL